MGRYDAEQLLRNIDRFLKEGSPPPASAAEAAHAEQPAERHAQRQTVLPDHFSTIKSLVLPELYTHAAVDKAPSQTRLALFKQLLLLIVRPFARRQAAFNHEAARGIEMLNLQVEALFKRELENERRDAQFHSEVQTHFENVRTDFDAMLESIASASDAIEEIRDQFQNAIRTIEEVRRTVPELQTGFESADKKFDVAMTLFTTWTPEIERLQAKVGEFAGKLHDAEAKLMFATEFRGEILERIEKLSVRSQATGDRMPETVRQELPAANGHEDFLADPQTNLAYVQFQRRFRGDEEMLRKHQHLYLDLIGQHLATRDGVRLLDIACGDGLFVEEAQKQNWRVLGVDLNSAMVRMARQRNLPVQEGDALAYLANAPDASYDVITAFQFIEHLPPAVLMELLRQIRRVLAPAGIAIFETINPNTLMAMKWFHLDLTHERLIFPQLLEILVESIGLVCIEHKGISDPPEYERMTLAGDEQSKKNFDKLNKALFGAQDYYLIARKAGEKK